MKNFLTTPVIRVEIDDRYAGSAWAKRLRRAVAVGLTLAVGYGVVSLFSLFRQNPFQVSVDHAVELGGWEPDRVHFDHGRYDYRYLYSDVRADLLVDGPEGRRPVRIELRNAPFSGWTVRSFQGRAVGAGVRVSSGP